MLTIPSVRPEPVEGPLSYCAQEGQGFDKLSRTGCGVCA
jgi:hypothetical protein